MKQEVFIDHINKLEFLEIGCTASEISDYLEGLTDERLESWKLGHFLSLPKTKLFNIDPDADAVKLAGTHFRLRKGKGTYKRKDLSCEKLRYNWPDNVYFRLPGTVITRIIYEIIESEKPSISIRLLDKLNEIGPVTKTQILSGYKSGTSTEALKWLKKHVSNRYIVRVDKNRFDIPNNTDYEKLYDLAKVIKISYNLRMKNLWKKFKQWERKKWFY